VSETTGPGAAPPTRQGRAGARRGALIDVALVVAGLLFTLAVIGGLHRRPHLTERGLELLLVLCVIAFVVWRRRALARLRIGALIALVALLLPLAALIGPSAAIPGLREVFGFRGLIALLVVLFLTWVLAARATLRVGARGFAIVLGLWFGWLLVTMAWAPDKGAGFRYLAIFLTMLILTAATAAAGASRRRLRWLALILALAYGLTVAVTIAEMTRGIHLPTSNLVNAGANKAGVVSSFFYNPNNLATYLAICWPFFLIVLFMTRRRLWLALAVVAMGLGLLALIHTGSRSSLLAMGVETAAALVYFARLRGIGFRRVGIVLGVVVVAAFIWLSLNNSSSQMLRQFRLATLLQGAEQGQGSGGTRLGLLKDGIAVGASYGFLGVGPGNAEGLVKAGPKPVGIGNLHDWWLEVLVDGGLPALALYVVFFSGLIAAMVRVARRASDPLLRYLAVGAALALVGYILGCLGPSTAVAFAPMWILFGLCLAIVTRAQFAAREGRL
jgi:hypothetical protein